MFKRPPKRHAKKIYKARYQSPKSIALRDGTQLGNRAAFPIQQSLGVGMHLNGKTRAGLSTSQRLRFVWLGMTDFRSTLNIKSPCHPDRPGDSRSEATCEWRDLFFTFSPGTAGPSTSLGMTSRLTRPLVPRFRLRYASAQARARLLRRLAKLPLVPSPRPLPFLARGERCGSTPCRFRQG